MHRHNLSHPFGGGCRYIFHPQTTIHIIFYDRKCINLKIMMASIWRRRKKKRIQRYLCIDTYSHSPTHGNSNTKFQYEFTNHKIPNMIRQQLPRLSSIHFIYGWFGYVTININIRAKIMCVSINISRIIHEYVTAYFVGFKTFLKWKWHTVMKNTRLILLWFMQPNQKPTNLYSSIHFSMFEVLISNFMFSNSLNENPFLLFVVLFSLATVQEFNMNLNCGFFSSAFMI